MHGYLACEGKTAHSVIDDKTAMPGASRLIASALPETFSYFALDAEPPIAGARTARAEASQSLGGGRLYDRMAGRLGIGFDPHARGAVQLRVT